jgi:hypothetical protein
MEQILNYNTKLSEDEKLMLLKIYSNMLDAAKEQDNNKNVNDKTVTITPEEYNEMLL